MMPTLNCGRCCSWLFINHFQYKHLNSPGVPSIQEKKKILYMPWPFPSSEIFGKNFSNLLQWFQAEAVNHLYVMGAVVIKGPFRMFFRLWTNLYSFAKFCYRAERGLLFNRWTLRWEVGQVQRGGGSMLRNRRCVASRNKQIATVSLHRFEKHLKV